MGAPRRLRGGSASCAARPPPGRPRPPSGRPRPPIRRSRARRWTRTPSSAPRRPRCSCLHVLSTVEEAKVVARLDAPYASISVVMPLYHHDLSNIGLKDRIKNGLSTHVEGAAWRTEAALVPPGGEGRLRVLRGRSCETVALGPRHRTILPRRAISPPPSARNRAPASGLADSQGRPCSRPLAGISSGIPGLSSDDCPPGDQTRRRNPENIPHKIGDRRSGSEGRVNMGAGFGVVLAFAGLYALSAGTGASEAAFVVLPYRHSITRELDEGHVRRLQAGESVLPIHGSLKDVSLVSAPTGTRFATRPPRPPIP